MHTCRYTDLSIDKATGTVLFDYQLDGTKTIKFREVMQFPLPADSPDQHRIDAFTKVLELLHIVAGTSYYKLAAPPKVVIENSPIAHGALPFINKVFTEGLGEFSYQNKLEHVLTLTIHSESRKASKANNNANKTPLVPIGGGKDSIVTVEALRRNGFTPILFAINPNNIIRSVVETSGLESLYAYRRLDPQLLALNQQGAYNGHIPVTAINSLIAVATAVLHGLGPVVMSNERSASIPNLTWLGHAINHQWSKGSAAETGLQAALSAHVGITKRYFSLLRSLSELHIARMFATITDYDQVITSCNAAFRLRNPTSRWCGNCPKCRFIFLALAPFMEPTRLTAIFDKNLLADLSQVPGYLELLGIGGVKPFECVGEIAESLVALRLVSENPHWQTSPVVQQLRSAVPAEQWPNDDEVQQVFTLDGTGSVPAAYQGALRAFD